MNAELPAGEAHSARPAPPKHLSPMQLKFYYAALDGYNPPDDPPFQDHLLFFYGSLTLPHILMDILSLPTSPTLKPAHIYGHILKMWGPYPALVKRSYDMSPDQVVAGMAYTVTKEEHLERLKQYQGEKYALSPCIIKEEGPEWATGGWTFKWNSSEDELEEGVFDANSFAET